MSERAVSLLNLPKDVYRFSLLCTIQSHSDVAKQSNKKGIARSVFLLLLLLLPTRAN
jgi:arginine/ornithine N-succinyltransferase beta subunit